MVFSGHTHQRSERRYEAVSSTKHNRFSPILLQRISLLVLLDILTVTLSAFLALYIRFEFSLQDLLASGFLQELAKWCLPGMVMTLALFCLFRLYSSLWEFAGADELAHIFTATGLSSILQFIFILTGAVTLPRSFPVLHGMLLFIITVIGRFFYRFVRRIRAGLSHDGRRRTMLIGAGEAGAAMLREFRNSDLSQNQVVCLIDDDPTKWGRQLMGVPIVGGRERIAAMVEKYRVSEIILAIPSISVKEKKAIWELCSQIDCKFKQMPSLSQLANGEVSIQAIRDVDIEDLLERDVIKVDMGGISDLIRGKTVMVTGGGGSIGSELCRQLASYGPEKLIIFDIYENNAYAIELELRRRYPELELHVLIGSVRDEKRIDSVMATHRPHIVYHAAAHKHVPLMERSPLEAVKNNIFGTLNTAWAAAKHGVQRFVLISTDKAVNPTNVMGASKRACEMVIQSLAGTCDTCFAAVRFGNVLGSNGSVIPLFREQIRRGGPVTVTHPEITRFFMTIPEAVTLVLQAGAFAKGGEIFVLDMGSPVKIRDLAENMIRLSGFEPNVDIMIEYTGLRPGEKLYEELLMNEEGLTRTANDLIYVGQKTDFDREAFRQGLSLLGSLEEGQEPHLRRCLQSVVPTYAPPKEPATC